MKITEAKSNLLAYVKKIDRNLEEYLFWIWLLCFVSARYLESWLLWVIWIVLMVRSLCFTIWRQIWKNVNIKNTVKFWDEMVTRNEEEKKK